MKERTFKSQDILHEMLLLRLQGWSITDLAFKYSCRKESVYKACIRSGVPKKIILLPRPIITFEAMYVDFDGERLNRGRSYEEYVRAQKERQLRKQFSRVGL